MNTYNTPLPKEYFLGKVQGKEENFTIDDLTRFQSHMLGHALSLGDISTFQVEESKRLQNIKDERLGLFHHHDCIPLRSMGNLGEIKLIISNLEKLGARSSIFERYTENDHDPREIRLDSYLFRRLGIDAYKRQLLGIISGNISASISQELFLEITRNKLKTLGCTEKYLDDFISQKS